MQGFDAHNPPFDRLTHAGDRGAPGGARHRVFPARRGDRPGGTAPSESSTSSSRGRSRIGRRRCSRPCSGRRTASTPAPSCTARPARISSPPRRRSAISIPAADRPDLIRRNPGFAAFFYSEVSRKLDAFAEQQRSRASRPSCGRASRTRRYGAAVFIDGAMTIEDAGRRMRDSDINALFVRDGERVGRCRGSRSPAGSSTAVTFKLRALNFMSGFLGTGAGMFLLGADGFGFDDFEHFGESGQQPRKRDGRGR